MTLNKIVYLLLLLRNQTKIYHWQTKFFSRHKASDELVEKLDELTDKYVETYQGLYQNLELDSQNDNIILKNIEDDQMQNYIISLRKLFIQEADKITNTELLNIKDEILHVIDKALYLFKLQ
jgi:DNA-binding ferritin-like protein